MAERRKAHFIDLYNSGRWRHYYTETQMVAAMRDAMVAADGWASIVAMATQADEVSPGPHEADQRYRA